MSDLPPSSDFDDASAAVDGDAAASARADEAMVDALRAVRAELAAVAPPPDDVRRRAVATALAELADTPVTLESRRPHRRTKFLLGAAAAAAVAVLGVAAVATLPGDDDQSAGDTASNSPAGDVDRAGVLASEAEGAEAADVTVGVTETIAAAAETAAERPVVATTGGGFTIDGPADVLPMLDSPADLASWAATIPAVAPGDGGAPTTVTASASLPSPETACDLQGVVVLGLVSYQGRPALAVRVVSTGTLRALAVDDCTMLAEAVP